MHFSVDGGEPFCLAGLWTCWTSPDGEVVPSCTIITCAANELARPIHDRMPVILADPEAWDAWLDPAVAAPDAQEILVPLASERMVVQPANPVVNSARQEGPDCLAALAA
jgi:putative SOS response-associated peptidase YedK